MREQLLLFIVASLMGGGGAFIGSVAGNAAGKDGFFVGAMVGGLIGSIASAYVARVFGWISAGQTRSTAFGAVLGLLIAAFMATQIPENPVGPVFSALTIGFGAMRGSVRRRPDRSAGSRAEPG